jgi:hypothetical protein
VINLIGPAKLSQTSEVRQALSRLRQLLNEPGFLRASLFRYRRPCGKHYCRCAQSKRYHHVSWDVKVSSPRGSQMKCLPEVWAEQVRLWIAHYREAEALLNKISRLYWDQLKRARR